MLPDYLLIHPVRKAGGFINDLMLASQNASCNCETASVMFCCDLREKKKQTQNTTRKLPKHPLPPNKTTITHHKALGIGVNLYVNIDIIEKVAIKE